MEALTSRLSSLESLPAVPAVVGELLALLAQEDRELEQVAELVRSDRALSLATLRRANSAVEGSRNEITTVEMAVTRLGSDLLAEIALGHFMEGPLSEAGRGYGLEGQQAWQGAIVGALAAETVARRLDGIDPSLAFTCGLLRDCGKLAMDELFGAEKLKETLRDASPDEDHLALEERVFGADHAQVGAALIHLWALPDRIGRCVQYHHSPPPAESAEADPLCDVVHVADIIASHLGFGVGYDGMGYTFDGGALERLGIDRATLSDLMVETAALSHSRLMPSAPAED